MKTRRTDERGIHCEWKTIRGKYYKFIQQPKAIIENFLMSWTTLSMIQNAYNCLN